MCKVNCVVAMCAFLILTWDVPLGAAISPAVEGRGAKGVAIDDRPIQMKVQVVNVTE